MCVVVTFFTCCSKASRQQKISYPMEKKMMHENRDVLKYQFWTHHWTLLAKTATEEKKNLCTGFLSIERCDDKHT
jgi:hypothetical protein